MISISAPRRVARLRTEVISMPLRVQTGHHLAIRQLTVYVLVQDVVIHLSHLHLIFCPRTPLVEARTLEFLRFLAHGLTQTRPAQLGGRLLDWTLLSEDWLASLYLHLLFHVGGKERTSPTLHALLI